MVQKVPVRYVPDRLTRKDRKKQVHMLNKSRKLYKSGKYYTRGEVKSFVSKESKHINRARKYITSILLFPVPNYREQPVVPSMLWKR